MSGLATTVALVVAALHICFLVLEMFLWSKPIGRRVFALSVEQTAATKVLAANQGLYNGFLAAGLVWGVIADERPVVLFFLICVALAGIFGALTVNRRIMFVQALPALIGITFILAS
ncbi:MAG: DUF1304 domain-containing protein [Actinomycetota bacterium]